MSTPAHQPTDTPTDRQPTVLMVEDSAGLAKLYSAFLARESLQLIYADNGRSALERLDAKLPDVMLLDLQLPDINGMEVLKQVHDQQLPVVTVIMTAHGSVEVAVEAMRLGAVDFIEKPFDAQRLRVTVRNAIERSRLSALVSSYREQFDRDRFHGFVGNSTPMQMVYRMIEASASSRATVFITGESGTGKEVCAEAIHRQGDRRDKPFIAINCAAIPSELIESELFGHRRGAFTGALQDRSGAVSRAHGGTLFLDEIGEMQLDLQSKLLRFIQTGRFVRIGGNREEGVDVRIICATNRDPLEQVHSGRLREDLYYRLHVVPIHLPPLREREGDTLLLANFFLLRYAEEEGKRFRGFSQEAELLLGNYPWPGNVRQLQNVLRNVTVLHNDDWVQASHLPEQIREAVATGDGLRVRTPQISKPTRTDIRPLAQVERQAIEQALEVCDGNVPQAAALLEVHPSTIYRKKQLWNKE